MADFDIYSVVSNMFYFHPYFGEESHFDDHIFQMCWFNHQLENDKGKWNIKQFSLIYFDLHPESLTNELKAETSRKKICHKHCFDPLGCSISYIYNIYTPPTLSFLKIPPWLSSAFCLFFEEIRHDFAVGPDWSCCTFGGVGPWDWSQKNNTHRWMVQ